MYMYVSYNAVDAFLCAVDVSNSLEQTFCRLASSSPRLPSAAGQQLYCHTRHLDMYV